MMNSAFKQTLKAKAHSLKPVVLLGSKGLTPAIIAETNEALTAHELIKVKMNGIERTERKLIANEIGIQLQANLIQLIGNVAVFYRKNC